jgi:hypothetical protein
MWCFGWMICGDTHLSPSLLSSLLLSLPTCKDEEDSGGGGTCLSRVRFFPPSLPAETSTTRNNQ